MVNIMILIGSTRPNRFGPKVAEWMFEQSKQIKDAKFTLVDVQDLALPLLDEPQIPMLGNYQNAHTKAWAKLVDAADGFVFVTPEYNHSSTPALINAIDYLAAEWRYKPSASVSYGADAGGARAIEHLRHIGGNLAIYDIAESVSIFNYWSQLDEKGIFTPTQDQNDRAFKLLTKLAFWAKEMKASRAKLG